MSNQIGPFIGVIPSPGRLFVKLTPCVLCRRLIAIFNKVRLGPSLQVLQSSTSVNLRDTNVHYTLRRKFCLKQISDCEGICQ